MKVGNGQVRAAGNGHVGGRSHGPSVAIVGAGFGGVGLGIQLKQAGYEDFTIFEKAEGVGGVWRANTYPGLTCDVPSHLYSFSFAPKHDWSCRFPKQPEILEYLEDCVVRYGIAPHLRLDTEVEAADFDEQAGRWRVRLAGGEEVEADVLVSATGQLSRPKYPDLPGIDTFRGHAFHSARWDHGYDLTGKRVGVIGTGASAIQFVPEIAPKVERLTIFQRSAPWVIKKPDRPYRAWEKRLYRRFPRLQVLSRLRVFLYYELVSLLMFTHTTRLGAPFESAFKRRVDKLVRDPALRARLVPDYPVGCKRILLSSDWVETLARPDVEVVTDPITQVTEDAVVSGSGREHPVDALIYATGFRTTEFLSPMRIRGVGGQDLDEAWRDGAEAHLGLMVSGFPNMFTLYGPNTNAGAGSIIFLLESQFTYVLEALRMLERSGATNMDVRPEVQREFNAEIQRRMAHTVWVGTCSNWYKLPSGKVTNNWPGLAIEYRRRTRRPDPSHFRIARPAPAPTQPAAT